jgi:RNA polymerase sigma-70 factor (ECF subfamily)
MKGQIGAARGMTIDSDTLLMLAGKGSRDAMGELYRRHKPQVVSFFRHMRASAEQAEDLAQEVFLRIWKTAGRYCPAGKYSSFMFTVAANVWRDQLRRSSLRETAWVQSEDIETAEDDHALPDSATAQAEFRRDLEKALGKLSESERMVFVLSEIESLSYRDIARILRCRIGTVGSRKTRAVKRLRQLLIKHAPEQYLKEVSNDEMSRGRIHHSVP